MLVLLYKIIVGPLNPQYIIEVINSWPFLIMIAILLFRKNIVFFFNKLLDIQTLKIKGVEIDFIKDLDSINSDLETEIKKSATNVKESSNFETISSWYKEIYNTIEYSPSYAILLTWNRLENEITAFSSLHDENNLSLKKKIKIISSKTNLSTKMINNIFKLRDLRNSVAHSDSKATKITELDAHYYLDTAAEIIIYLNSLNSQEA